MARWGGFISCWLVRPAHPKPPECCDRVHRQTIGSKLEYISPHTQFGQSNASLVLTLPLPRSGFTVVPRGFRGFHAVSPVACSWSHFYFLLEPSWFPWDEDAFILYLRVL